MFDWYQPVPAIGCPRCGAATRGWQRTDADCVPLVWRQGVRRPVEHRVSEDVRFDDATLREIALPETFALYATCGEGHAVAATGRCAGGVWRDTVLDAGPPRAQGV